MSPGGTNLQSSEVVVTHRQRLPTLIRKRSLAQSVSVGIEVEGRPGAQLIPPFRIRSDANRLSHPAKGTS